MPSKKHSTTWPADPHTLAKISILRSYLDAYFLILGSSASGQKILYIDGFAGPGEYENNHSGSPVAAVKSALQAVRSSVVQWKAECIYLAFIEKDKDRVNHLRGVLQEYENEPEIVEGKVRFQIFSGTFVNQIESVRNWCPLPFQSGAPLFAFVDPFGATGVPLSVVRDLLSTPRSEIFFNLDADGIARILKASMIPANVAHINAIFNAPGVEDSWTLHLDDTKTQKELVVDILDLYKYRLRQELGMKYVFAFDMSTTQTAFNYYLVFATRHPRGLEKMKEAMNRIDKTGTYRFIDTTARTGQIVMNFNDPSIHATVMFEVFKGDYVRYEEIHDWSLNDSPFRNPKSMLSDLQTRGLISVETIGGVKLVKGQFPEDKIASIQFATARNKPFPPKK